MLRFTTAPPLPSNPGRRLMCRMTGRMTGRLIGSRLHGLRSRPTLRNGRDAQHRRRAGRLFVIFIVVAVVLAAGASSVSAHTQLLSTDPPTRSSFEETPEQLTLTFAEAVSPRSVRLEIVSLTGETIEGARLLTSAADDQTVIDFALPDLDDGVYGLAWVTVGPDGHRVSGEVVIGVGAADASDLQTAEFRSTPLWDRILSVGGALARYVWYLGLALIAGALFILYYGLRRRGLSGGGSAEESAAANDARSLLKERARRALVTGALTAHAGISLRAFATISLVTRGYDTGSVMEDLRLTLTEGQGLILLGSVLGGGVLVIWAPRLARSENPLTLLQAGLALMVVIAAGSANSHTAVLSSGAWEWTGIWISTLHLAASSLWLGPLLIFGMLAVSRRWRALGSSERSTEMRSLLGSFAPLAAVSFGVLLLTGLRSTLLLAGRELLSNDYGIALLAKFVLIAVVVLPLAVYNDWNLGLLARWRRRGGHPVERLGLKKKTFLGLEAGALGAVAAAAAVIVSMNPAVFSGGGASENSGGGENAGEISTAGYDALSGVPPESVDVCAELVVGKADCYRAYFANLMRLEGADVAVSEVNRLRTTHAHIRQDCHQVVHDLGNDAAEYYGDIGIALTYEGSACWSGYYHGVVEYAISKLEGETLYEELPNICTSAAANRYSFTHYNCVHGLGHGVMLNLDGDLFAALNFCEALPDPWELSSCVGGSFMENVTAAQQGLLDTDLSSEDLVYPCDSVKESFVDECWAMQTSWILSQVGYTDEGFKKGFNICNGIREDMIRTCYGSMGRDASGFARLDVDTVLRLCSLGDPEYQVNCWVSASLNAVYSEHGTAKATELCERVPQQYQEDCYRARDHAASTF